MALASISYHAFLATNSIAVFYLTMGRAYTLHVVLFALAYVLLLISTLSANLFKVKGFYVALINHYALLEFTQIEAILLHHLLAYVADKILITFKTSFVAEFEVFVSFSFNHGRVVL